MALAHSSVIVTTTAVDTRTRDQLSFPFTARPQAMTIYVRFVEAGTITLANFQRILLIGSVGASTPYIAMLVDASGFYYVSYRNGVSAERTSVLTVAPIVGDRVELLATLTAAGVVTMNQSINGGTVLTASPGVASVLPTAWSNTILRINSDNAANVGFNAYRNVHIAAGVKTMQNMRVLAGTD